MGTLESRLFGSKSCLVLRVSVVRVVGYGSGRVSELFSRSQSSLAVQVAFGMWRLDVGFRTSHEIPTSSRYLTQARQRQWAVQTKDHMQRLINTNSICSR